VLRAWVRSRALRGYLRVLQAYDRVRLARLARAHPGLEIDPTASTNLASARFELGEGARLRIGAGVHTERIPGGLVLHVGPGARLEIGDSSWLRCEVEPIRIVAFDGAQLEIGRDCWLNGCQLSAKLRIEVAEGAQIGPGTRIYDSDHALDEASAERCEAVRIGKFTWIASDTTVLRGVEIGDHSVIGTRSVVTRSIPPHSLAYGNPARPRGKVGQRRAFL